MQQGNFSSCLWGISPYTCSRLIISHHISAPIHMEYFNLRDYLGQQWLLITYCWSKNPDTVYCRSLSVYSHIHWYMYMMIATSLLRSTVTTISTVTKNNIAINFSQLKLMLKPKYCKQALGWISISPCRASMAKCASIPEGSTCTHIRFHTSPCKWLMRDSMPPSLTHPAWTCTHDRYNVHNCEWLEGMGRHT